MDGRAAANERVTNRTPSRWRSYLWYRRRRFQLRRARGFNAKVQYRMYADRRDELITFADRVAARDFVSRRVGEGVLTDLYGVIATADALDDIVLPRDYVMKATHGSGGILIVSGSVGESVDLPAPGAGWTRSIVSPDAATPSEIRRLCGEWLSLRYTSALSEWAYTRVPPRVMFEELLLDESGNPPSDYKFFVFDGVPRLVQVDVNRFSGHLRNLYSPEWELLDVTYLYPQAEQSIARPNRLDEMLEVAAQLGSGIDFIRIDLYSLGDRIVVGELTNYPEGGYGVFQPSEFDLELGRHWKPNRHRHVADARNTAT
jgi:TupA-like ATPgrasp